ncbi:MAG: type I restriction enzyme endonuclease domain-containing protein [Betaproteobacteria bacterium]
MWLTGTDIPCLHTLYVDKPMRGHNVIQAISRVNRVFRDKPHGLIVDYIGIGDELRDATSKYAQGGGQGEPAPDVEKEAWPVFERAVAAVRDALPKGRDWAGWRQLSAIAFEDLHMEVFGWLTEEDVRRDEFLDAEMRLTHAYLLVKHLSRASPYADEVIFCQRVRRQIAKTLPGKRPPKDLAQAVRDLVDDHVEAEGVFDIFKLSGIETPDVSILDDRFLQTFRERKHENLRLKLLAKPIADELTRRAGRNPAKTRSFRELLEQTLERCHKRIIDAAAVVKAMVQIAKEMRADDKRAKELNLSEEELAFYDTVRARYKDVHDEPFLRDLVHDVVLTIKANLKVDWTEPHRENVTAAVRAAVRRVLWKRDIKAQDFDVLLAEVMRQAEALWAEWPLAA